MISTIIRLKLIKKIMKIKKLWKEIDKEAKV